MTIETNSVDKFAFIGPASVGKTTMTNIFRNHFEGHSDVAILDEAAEIFFEENKKLPKRFIDIQQQLQDFVLARERGVYEPEKKLIISDRSVIDPIVYAQVYDGQKSADELHQRVSNWIPTYTSFILLNPEGVPDDPRLHRLETSQDRLTIYNSFIEFCKGNELPYVEISGSINQRKRKVHTVIYENTRDKNIFRKDN